VDSQRSVRSKENKRVQRHSFFGGGGVFLKKGGGEKGIWVLDAEKWQIRESIIEGGPSGWLRVGGICAYKLWRGLQERGAY